MRLVYFFIGFFFLPLVGFAFPENVRHGYISCTACHVSPSGGGVLTPYGRSLSAELMSTWGTSKNAGFFFSDNEDEKKNPPWFRANVFLRGVQTRRSTPAFEKGQFIPMQADVEAGYDSEKFAIIAAIGSRSKNLAQSKDFDQVFSRRHYLLYRVNDNWNARVGKFMFSYGLNGPDHITATRRGLGWDQGSESYNFEISFLGEKSSTLLTAVSSDPIENFGVKDKGVALNQSFLIGEKSKLGFSGFSGGQDAYSRYVLGPYGIWSISKDWFLDTEIFYQQKKISTSGISQSGYSTFNRLGYEFTKGLILYAQFDRSFLNTSNELSKSDNYGPGFQWFPYPHLELQGYLGKEKAAGQEATDFWWLMFGLYL